MKQAYVLIAIVVIALFGYNTSASLTPGNILAVGNEQYQGFFSGFVCTNNGSLMELKPDGQIVQKIELPAECLFSYTNYAGYITLSKDRLSAVLPCCTESGIATQIVGFVEIYFNGTTSAMKTIELPLNKTLLHNIALDGDDLWFVARDIMGAEDGSLFYANAESGDVVQLAVDDLFFIDIINNKLLVSNFLFADDGILQVGSGLPKTENQMLTPVLNLGNSVDWFVNDDNGRYCYYAQYGNVSNMGEDTKLIRCDPNTWEPLYILDTTDEIVHFAVLYNNDTDITIVATMALRGATYVALFHDNGKEISLVDRTDNSTDYVIKIGSLVPISHCVDGKMDFDETDVDCGGSLCDTCQVGKKCSSNTDCASNYCDSTSSTCAEPAPVSAPTNANGPAATPKSKTSAGSTFTFVLGSVVAMLVLVQ